MDLKAPPRKLRSWEAAALSIGFMGPVLAMALNGIGVAGLVGTAVPLTFLVAFAGTCLIAYGFVRLTRKFNHAGSVYALAGHTIGPRAGFFGGFALLGTYLAFAACTLAACGVFFGAWLDQSGIANKTPWILVSAAAGVLVLLANLRESRFVTSILLAIGGTGILLMLGLGVVILYQVSTGAAPVSEPADLTPFTFAGTTPGIIMTASVFAFLSWAGFESCASLGEETRNPKKAIPLALGGSVVGAGIIYVFIMYVQTVGFGNSAAGAAGFAASESSLTQLAAQYIGPGYAQLLAFSAFAVAFASTLSSTASGARLVFALARDGFGPASLGKLNPKTGTPTRAVVAVFAVTLTMALILFLSGVGAFDSYYWYATVAVLCLLVAYGTTTVGVIMHILRADSGIPRWELLMPVLGLAYLCYVFFVQTVGQEAPYSYFPYIAAAWCLLGFIVILARPSLARSIGDRLVNEQN
ncbi:APC family permease [Paeniglutamicibacter cryotolerans]|nr:APC family permease [Paeniglutamicibacter cryotolerans]